MKSPLAMLLTGLALAAPVGAADPSAEIARASKALAGAMQRRAVADVMTNLTTDFKKTDEAGKERSREEYQASLHQFFHTIERVVAMTRKLGKLTPRGNAMEVEVSTLLQAEVHDQEGRYGPAGKKQIIDIAGVDRETWTKTGATWRLQASRTVSRAKAGLSRK